MSLMLPIYYGVMFYATKKLVEYSNNNLNEQEPDEDEENDILYSLNINIDKDNIIYQSFNNEVIKNNLDTNKKILVCCTGDYQSMALLTVAMNIFNRENISVLTINNDDNIVNFMEKICDDNNLTFHNVDFYFDKSSNEIIKDICENNNIDYVFEGHTLINHSNNILNNLFTNKKEEVHTNIRPFLFIDKNTLLKFCSTYNIPINNCENKNEELFDKMEKYISNIYPNWRINIINENSLFNTTELENRCIQGKHGYLVKEDFNKISFIMFKQLVDNLSEKYGFEKVDVDDLNNYYMDDEEKIYFVSNTFLNKIDIFERYLQSNELQYFIEDLLEEDASENSFENLDKEETNNETQTEDNNDEEEQNNDKKFETSIYEDLLNNVNTDTFKDNKEYILKVDLNNDVPDIKIVDKLSDNFDIEYLDGIIYVNISNNNFYVYDVNFNK